MKKKCICLGVCLIILLLLFSIYLYFYCNGLVFIDGKLVTNIHLEFDDDGEHILIPVIASLCELGYEKISEDNDIILLQNKDQVLTVDLNMLSLTCPQVSVNCISPMPGNTYYFCERKGNDILIDSNTFAGTLSCIDCDYAIAVNDPYSKIIKYTYHERIESEQLFEEFIKTLPKESSPPEKQNIVTEGRLIVNGVDITEGNYVRIHHGTQNAELPMLAILREIGYDAKMRYNQELDIYESVIEDQIGFFSTAYEDFDIPFAVGEKGCVRKIENDDFIIDSNCVASAMYWYWQADIIVDYSTSTVYVNSCDPWA